MWTPYAGQAGEVPVTLEFPEGQDAQSYLEGGHEWHWTAHFEALAANFDTIEGSRATPEGTYRFVVDGRRRQGGQPVPYHLESEPFRVAPWDGITVEDLRAERAGRISFTVGPRRKLTVSSGGPSIQAEIGPIDYPDSYASPVRFINNARQAFRDPAAPSDPARLEWYCFACSFRPWADTGRPDRAWLTVVRADGTQERLRAQLRGDRFIVSRPLKRGERAYVAAGDVTDALRKRERTAVVRRQGPRLRQPRWAFPGVLVSPSRGTLLGWDESRFASGDSFRGRSRPIAPHPARRGVPSTSSTVTSIPR